MSDNMKLWNEVKTPPEDAMKLITGGRLSGYTDINPQWRYEILTKHFGICGIGWKYDVVGLWTTGCQDGCIFAHSQINLYIKDGDKWSEPIPGIGGAMFVAKERDGLYHDDDAYKKATTDALSVACKMLGIGADVYRGFTETKQPEAIRKPNSSEFVKASWTFSKEQSETYKIAKSKNLCYYKPNNGNYDLYVRKGLEESAQKVIEALNEKSTSDQIKDVFKGEEV